MVKNWWGSVLDALYGVGSKEFSLLFLTVNTAEEAFNLYFTGKLHDAVYHSLGTGGTTGHEDVDGHDILNAFGYVIALAERAAGDGATAAGDDIFRLGKPGRRDGGIRAPYGLQWYRPPS